MIPIGATLLRLEPYLKGYLRVYKLQENMFVVYTTERVQEAHSIDSSPYREKALEVLKKRMTIMAADESRKPCL